MADLEFVQNISTRVAVTSTPTTHLSLTAPTNQRVVVVEQNVSFDGTSSTGAKVLCELILVTGTVGGTPGTSTPPTKVNPSDDETLQTTGAKTWSVEPTGTVTVIDSQLIHPQSAWFRNKPVIVKGGAMLGWRLSCSSAVNGAPHFAGRE